MSRQCIRETQRESPSKEPRHEVSTHRMSIDEVRAFIRQFEPEPPPRVPSQDVDDLEPRDPTAAPEPPTLLYRGRRAGRARAPVAEPGTLMGWGVRAWLESARELTPHPRASASPPSLPDRQVLDATPAASSERASGPLPLPAGQRVWQWRRRARWSAGALAVLVLSAPVLMRSLGERAAIAPQPGAPASEESTGVRQNEAARAVTLATEGATQQRMDDARRATTLMMTGDSAGALHAFRMLARAWPEHPALPRLVRLLEDELRKCAAQGGAACR